MALGSAALERTLAELRSDPDVIYAEPVLPQAQNPRASTAQDTVTVGHVLVRMAGGRAPSEEDIADLSTRTATALRVERAMSGGGYVFALPADTTLVAATEVVRRLNADPRVEHAEVARMARGAADPTTSSSAPRRVSSSVRPAPLGLARPTS